MEIEDDNILSKFDQSFDRSFSTEDFCYDKIKLKNI